MYVFRRLFFRSPFSWLDTAVTAGSAVLFIIHAAAAATNVALGVALHWIRAVRAAIKLANVARIYFSRSKSLARHLVGQNKRRFVDLELEIDLNLTYIRPELIAMGAPAVGLTSLYRNPLEDVVRACDLDPRPRDALDVWLVHGGSPLTPDLPRQVRFFESRHPARYKIYNCCPELPYPTEPFVSGQFACFDVQAPP